MRTLVIGDIHGGLRALKQVLERSSYNMNQDQLIFLGDYCDGWSETYELLCFLIDLEFVAGIKPIFIRGNHDRWTETWMSTGIPPKGWLQNGGQTTVDSYGGLGGVPHTHVMFLYKLNNYYIDDKNRGFVHGGFKSKLGLGNDHYHSDYYWDRDLWQLALLSHGRVHEEYNLSGGVPHSRRFERHKEVFIGHTSTCNWNCKPHFPEYKNEKQESKNGAITVPMNRCNVWNLDTGAGWYGKLTIMDIDTKDFWQSDLVRDLYPEEKGR